VIHVSLWTFAYADGVATSAICVDYSVSPGALVGMVIGSVLVGILMAWVTIALRARSRKANLGRENGNRDWLDKILCIHWIAD
jgi:hypothetical protein